MAADRPQKPRPPLDAGRLDELALRYVGRFATTRAKLHGYLQRKVRQRGWGGDGGPPLEAIVERLADLGYIDDAAFAMAKTRALSSRGYGKQRVQQSLHAAGVGDDDSVDAIALADSERVEAALRFARRRRLGPFAADAKAREERERAIAAMIRAGHSFALSRAIVAMEPGANVDLEALVEKR
ncbi:RecX family transcriptional regulator [Sphingomonas sinipercae]|uniref:Regulatory protein RecX n=2 Tax=Sphingomonas sinipercae TaxID=2714944 RepID=A0A6G7ZR57_9SPHN|nr:RecX family transcriptional regulator [Sphingomonas sinipercae]QIL03390.1 RecX family transcriptional regulator [Sphingomonas sinipercae]